MGQPGNSGEDAHGGKGGSVSCRDSNSANGSEVDPGKSLAAARYRPTPKWRVFRRAWRHACKHDKFSLIAIGVSASGIAAVVAVMIFDHFEPTAVGALVALAWTIPLDMIAIMSFEKSLRRRRANLSHLRELFKS